MRTLQDYLGVEDDLRRLSREARRLADLDRAYRRAVPDGLAKASGVSHVEAGTVYLWADGGAVGAKLRQLAPTVLVTLRKLAPDCRAVRVTVRVDGTQIVPSRSVRRQMGAGGAAALQELARTLPPTPLSAALSRLAARGGRQSEDGQ
jgi:hypothetical protein